MRTTDFSHVPPMGQATAMFVGATRYRGLRPILAHALAWHRMVRRMRRLPGYCWHTVYWKWPFTLGTIALFRDRDALLKFARTKHHRDLMCWITDHGTRNATGGFIRLYTAEESGYTNGVWRAEDDTMSHIETFTPLSRETEGPSVHRRSAP